MLSSRENHSLQVGCFLLSKRLGNSQNSSHFSQTWGRKAIPASQVSASGEEDLPRCQRQNLERLQIKSQDFLKLAKHLVKRKICLHQALGVDQPEDQQMERESETISELRPGQRNFQNHFWVVGTPMTVYERCLLAQIHSFVFFLWITVKPSFQLSL